ncbi:MAG: hypothetical protein Q7J32_18320, partial [Sphingomonadaceae bacterium]|nr:hypothetical protein [Sphingomonadaceae bacterium]
MKTKSTRQLIAAGASLLSIAIAAAPAVAQSLPEPQPGTQANTGGGGGESVGGTLSGTAVTADEGIEEIVVTAQRAAQSLQDVPIAVSAFTAEALDRQQIENPSDLQL